MGQKASLWQKLGGGTRHVIVLFFADHMVLSTRGSVRMKEAFREVRPADDLAGIDVTSGPMMSSVTFRFVDGSTMKLANVGHAEVAPLRQLMSEGPSAFDRPRLGPEALTAFFYACNHGLPLPDDLFATAA